MLDAGHDPVAVTRDPEKLGRFGWCDPVRAVVPDADDQTSVESAFTVAGQADVAYCPVHGIGQPGFRERDNVAAAVIIGAGSTSFEPVRYVGDRLWLITLPPWADHDVDPISIRDVLYYRSMELVVRLSLINYLFELVRARRILARIDSAVAVQT